MFRKFFTLIGTLAILAGGIGFIFMLGQMRPKIEPTEIELAPPSVFYEAARAKPVKLNVYGQGEVRPRTDINLTAEVAGKIVRTSGEFVVGGAFAEGDMLVKIEDADYQVAVTGARARVAQALEALRREEAEADLAKREYDALGRSENPSALALRQPQLAQARASYAAAEADLRSAQLNLDRTEIRAPFQGRVRERLAGEGQFVSPGAAIGRIFSTDIAEIRMAMTDSDLAKLGLPLAFSETPEKPGPQVTLSAFIAGEFHEWNARIARTDGAIDPATRQISVIAVVDDPYGAGSDDGTPLAMGLYVDAVIQGKEIDNAIILPRSALYGRDTVYVIGEDDTLEKRTISLVASDRDTITLTSGVHDGERVVTSPLRGAEDGDKVTPADRTNLPGSEGDVTPEAAAVAEAIEPGAPQ
ncbi:MAG: efflux RND transporter periplasmic adaptor subunit [Parvularculaceae bacterium]|nr:efflux RND transporter periplasmic adaptor subunit [Parvularculaceae bacterium]